MEYVTRSGAQIAGPPFGSYGQLGGDGFNVSASFPVTDSIEGDGHVVPFELPGGRAATTVHTASDEKLPQAYAALMEQAGGLGEEIDPQSTMWEEYLTGPELPEEQTQTAIYWPVKKSA